MRWLRRILAVGCLALAGVSVFATATQVHGDKNLQLAALGVSFDGTAMARILRSTARAAITGQTEIPDAQAALLRDALKAEPLNHAAHSAWVLGLRQSGDASFSDFVAAASTLRPRTPTLIALSMETAMEDGDLEEVFRLLDRLNAVRPGVVQAAMPAILDEIEKTPGQVDFALLLAQEPTWSRVLLTQAASRPDLLPLVAAGRIEAGDAPISSPDIDGRLIERLIAIDEFDLAWSLHTLAADRGAAFNSNAGQPAAPFEWTLVQNANQSVQMTGPGDLELSLTRGGGVAARRIVRNAEGSWTLTAAIERNGSRGHDLIVRAACAGSPDQPRTIAVAPPDAQSLSASFSATASDCDYQIVEIATERREALSTSTITLKDLTIG